MAGSRKARSWMLGFQKGEEFLDQLVGDYSQTMKLSAPRNETVYSYLK
jgi:hypothetical protein